jgi:hypothetical protein
MLVAEVKELFRAYCDEPDETFLSNANVNTYLARGYDVFRRKITALDPYTYAIDVNLVVTSDSYDLANVANPVVLLGANVPAGTLRMMELVAIRTQSSGDSYQGFQMKGTAGLKGLLNTYRTYTLVGTVLAFSESVDDTIILTYVPEQGTDWAAGTFIDDMSQFHDMIALYAFQQYQIREAEFNRPLMEQLGRRERDLDGYVVDRNVDASHYIQRTMDSYEDF